MSGNINYWYWPISNGRSNIYSFFVHSRTKSKSGLAFLAMAEIEFKAILSNFYDSGVYWGYVNVPLELAEKVRGKERRVVCSLSESIEFHCALMHNGKGGFFINIKKEFQKKLAVSDGDELTIKLREDASKYGFPVSEAFLELLYQDPDGDAVFHSLTKGKQRSLIHLVNKVKSEQLQLEKAHVILDYLKSVNGKLDYKELNMAFKNNRFRK